MLFSPYYPEYVTKRMIAEIKGFLAGQEQARLARQRQKERIDKLLIEARREYEKRQEVKMKLDGEEYRVKELEWVASDVVGYERLNGSAGPYLFGVEMNFEFQPLQYKMYFLSKGMIYLGDKPTLPEAKAFCQEHLEGEVMKLVRRVE